jgi:hypothetical protein
MYTHTYVISLKWDSTKSLKRGFDGITLTGFQDKISDEGRTQCVT